jgi:hypothetical protein
MWIHGIEVGVENRFVAVVGAALAVIAGMAGCSSSPPAAPQRSDTLPPHTAQLAINGKAVGNAAAVNCFQADWLWTIEAGDKAAGATAVVQTGDMLTAKSVQIRNLGGFTGTYWEGNGGKADASVVDNMWTITGTVQGFNTDNPRKPATGNFKIKANC